ncbi:MAG: TIM barrel protein [Gammaproteobacteria bacterium]|nr:TIM barrel protein [Gammaproteobacteria bacterium]
MWPGLVGKGPDSEPPIDLDTMLDLTANTRVNGVGFDGVDLFLSEPHTPIDADDGHIKALADKIQSKGLQVGTCIAPVWEPTGGGSAMGGKEEQDKFLNAVKEACRIASKLNDLGIRKSGVVRIDSSCSPADWAKDPAGNTKKIAATFRAACDIASDYGERLAAEGEICWGGMHSWKAMLDTLEETDREGVIGFQADMAHTLLYTEGYNAPESRIIASGKTLDDPEAVDEAIKTMTAALRPWTMDFHVAQNDGTVKGEGSHDKTGRHCLPDDPNGKLDIPRHAGAWLRDESGELTRAFDHICWDGCMFTNAQLMDPATWESILGAMISVREQHGWTA